MLNTKYGFFIFIQMSVRKIITRRIIQGKHKEKDTPEVKSKPTTENKTPEPIKPAKKNVKITRYPFKFTNESSVNEH